jgi:dUTP pyrophosphatase
MSTPGLLSRQGLLARIAATPPLIEGAVDIATQVQPNGVDLTLRDISQYQGPGLIDFSNARRTLPQLLPVPFDAKGEAYLKPGAYLVTFNEIVSLPLDLAALGRTRSSLLRCGAALHTAVWDAGYSGRSQSLMMVYNEAGLALTRDARIMQLVFYTLDTTVAEGYQGTYQGENVVSAAVIYLLRPAEEAKAALTQPFITAPSLMEEGFLHGSATVEQCLAVANRKYGQVKHLAALVVDTKKLTSKLQYDRAKDGQLYPHIYGPLNREAITGVQEVRRDGNGKFAAFG